MTIVDLDLLIATTAANRWRMSLTYWVFLCVQLRVYLLLQIVLVVLTHLLRHLHEHLSLWLSTGPAWCLTQLQTVLPLSVLDQSTNLDMATVLWW